MKGLALSRAFFEKYGKEMLETEFPEYKDRIAVGLVGHGSECFGFDDEISRDHDFDASFSLWLTDEDYKKIGFKLSRALSKLPKEYKGISLKNESLSANKFKGVFSIPEFFSFYIPNGEVPKTAAEFLRIPDFYLAEATNGEVFCDGLGEFTKIRNALKNCPEDARLKKLASAVFNMAQSGQYNYLRTLSHGENAAAALCLSEFATASAHAVYLLNFSYMPYYKWAVRGMRELLILNSLADDLTELLKQPYNKEKNAPLIEKICSAVINELKNQGVSSLSDSFLEPHAYNIQNKISNPLIRNSNIIL